MHVFEWAGFDTTTSLAWREDDEWHVIGGNVSSVVLPVTAVAAHGGVTAVEDWCVVKIHSILRPIEIRLVPSIAAFISQSLLIGEREVSVPGKKVALQ